MRSLFKMLRGSLFGDTRYNKVFCTELAAATHRCDSQRTGVFSLASRYTAVCRHRNTFTLIDRAPHYGGGCGSYWSKRGRQQCCAVARRRRWSNMFSGGVVNNSWPTRRFTRVGVVAAWTEAEFLMWKLSKVRCAVWLRTIRNYSERKCAKNYNKSHNKFIFQTALNILVISNHNSFRVLFDNFFRRPIFYFKNIFIF